MAFFLTPCPPHTALGFSMYVLCACCGGQGFGAAVAMSAMVAYTYFSMESTKPSSASSTPKRNRSELDFGGAHHNGGYGGDGTDLRSAKPEAKPWTRGGGGPRRRGASSAFII